jgi:type IV pilus assembly protein PilC
MGLMSPQISTKTLVPICRQLSTAYDAGIPLVQALSLTRNALGDTRAKEVLGGMEADIRAGSTLAEAAQRQRRYLPPILLSLLAAGEAGGRLDAMLGDLADYYEERLAMRRTIMGMLALPTLQLLAAWFLGTFAIGLVGNLSLDPRSKFTLGGYFNQYLVFQGSVLLAAGIGAAAVIALGRAGVLRGAGGMLSMRLWPLSLVTRRYALARFFRSFALLIASGLPIHRAIEHSAAAAGNSYVERQVLGAIPPVMEGQTLTEAFSRVRVLTPAAREMLHVGEESGRLDRTLRKVADYHMAEANHAVQIATRVAGVGIVLLVGLVVGYVVITFYTRYYGDFLNSI